MYNRYIPQPDGTYKRSSMPDRPSQGRKRPPAVTQSDPAPQIPEPPCEIPAPEHRSRKPSGPGHPGNPSSRRRAEPEPGPAGIGDFLKQIIPEGFDTADLMVVLLLLLMGNDCAENRNWALLTLVLYLFL